MKATEAEKLILVMLSDVHEHLQIEDSVDPKFVRSAVQSGNLWALRWQYPGIFDIEETPEAIVTETVDVLEMWYLLEAGYQNLSQPDKDRVEAEATPFGEHVQFRGFDGNNETDYMGAARFLINDLDRFTTFQGRDLNSHAPSIDTYRRMLEVFAPIRASLGGSDPNADQIIGLLKAMKHPENED